MDALFDGGKLVRCMDGDSSSSGDAPDGVLVDDDAASVRDGDGVAKVARVRAETVLDDLGAESDLVVTDDLVRGPRSGACRDADADHGGGGVDRVLAASART